MKKMRFSGDLKLKNKKNIFIISLVLLFSGLTINPYIKVLAASNLALGKLPASSASFLNNARLTDGDKNTSMYASSYNGLKWVQLDLGAPNNINDIKLWHYYGDGRKYYDVIVQLSNDPSFTTGVTTVFNNDIDNSAKLGAGSDVEYAETISGNDISFDAVNARYVRLYSNGSNVNAYNHYVEVEVYASDSVIVPTSVSLNKTSAALVEGGNTSLTATVLPSDAANKNVTWSSSAPGVATVSSTGTVTALSVGTATVTAKTADGGKTASCTVTVTSATVHPSSVSLNKTSASLVKGGSTTLTATVLPSDAANKNVTWSSSAPGVATVSATGKVTAVSAGTSTITAKTADGGKTASCKITVTTSVVYPDAIIMNVNLHTFTVLTGESNTLTVTVMPENTTDKSVTWSSSATDVATVSANGVVTGKKAGTATITATSIYGWDKVSCNVTVTTPEVNALKPVVYQTTPMCENVKSKFQYNYAENIHDGRGINFGCVGFCTGTYDGNMLIKYYTKLNPNNTLAKYIPALDYIDSLPHGGDGNDSTDRLDGLDGFITDVQNCNDPLFKEAQLYMVDQLYWNPAVKLYTNIGAKNPLTMAFIYDCVINSGEDGAQRFIDSSSDDLGGTPKTGINENTFLSKMMDNRYDYLINNEPDGADRVNAFRRLLTAGNVNLITPTKFTVYGVTFTLDGTY